MNDIPSKDNGKNMPDKQSGEIYSANGQSPYEAARDVVEEDTLEPRLSQPEKEAPPVQLPADDQPKAAAPYTENKSSKFIVLILLIIIFLGAGFFIFKFLLKPKAKPVPVNISLNYWGLWESEEVMKGVIEDYQKAHPEITIVYKNQNPKLYRERLEASIERGEGPDIFRFHNTWVPIFNNILAPVPASVYTKEEFQQIFYPVAVSDLVKNDVIYGVPLQIEGLILLYNEDILQSANISVPITWTDVQEAVQKITVRSGEEIVTAGIALGTVNNIEHSSDILSLMMLQNRTIMRNSLFSCVDETKSTCASEALAFYRKFSEFPGRSWSENMNNSILAFSQGKAAMILAPSWQILTILDGNKDLNLKTAQVPQLPCEKEPCSAVNWATYWVEGVNAKSPNQKAAWDFVKYLSQKETMQKLYEAQLKERKLFGGAYSRVDMGKGLMDNPYLAPLIAEAPTMKSFYTSSRTNDGITGLNSSLNGYLESAVNSLSGGVSPETALKTADDGFKQVFARFGMSPPY